MYWIEIIGTIAFAISGIRLAALKQFDLFGLYTIGFATAVGGGTIRDLLLGVRPFWFYDFIPLLVVLLSLVFFYFYHELINKIAGTIFLFDTIGLGIFTLIGLTKALDCGCSSVIAIIIGMVTGAGGGLIRDICISETPLACVFGGIAYFLLAFCSVSPLVQNIGCMATVIIVRYLSTKYCWQLPRVKM